MARLHKDIGHVTPKVGVDGAVFSEDGKLLLVQRTDDRRWCLPGGWAEQTETAQEGVIREVREETGLTVAVDRILEVFTRFPHEYGEPHTLYQLLFLCHQTGGSLSPSSETISVGFYEFTEISEWHFNHRQLAQRAVEEWRCHHSGTSYCLRCVDVCSDRALIPPTKRQMNWKGLVYWASQQITTRFLESS